MKSRHQRKVEGLLGIEPLAKENHMEDFPGYWKFFKWLFRTVRHKYLRFESNLEVDKKDRRVGFFYMYYEGPFYGVDLWYWNFTMHDQLSTAEIAARKEKEKSP